jgi:GNAT superfamily N-acetyltransferase
VDTEALTCTVVDGEDADLAEYINRRLEAFNERQSPWILQKRMPGRGPQPVQVCLRNAEGDTFGGVLGFTLWDWLEIEELWIWEGVRGHGWGRKLLDTIEAAARERGCKHAHVSTWSFQAPDFYQACGYRIIGQLDDYPPGHTDYWLRKDFQ